MQELKNLYDTFKESGDLLTLYPDMTGEWETDKDSFTKQMKPAAQAFQNDIETVDDEF